MAEPDPKLVTPDTESDHILPPDSFYNSSFELDVDFELTLDDLYFPSENESFSIPVDATEAMIACKKTSTAKRKQESEEDTSMMMSYKYRRLEEEEDDEEEEKRRARLVRNRESALLSRQRRKHYVEELEDKVKSLQSVITDLNSKVSYFMSENATLRHTVGSGKGMCWPPSGMYPTPYNPWMPFQAYQVVPLLPIPRLKPQRSLGEVKRSEGKTKKVASVSVLGLLFCLFLFGAFAPIVNVSYGGRVLDVSVNSKAQCGRGNVSATENSLPLRNGSELLVASLFVPRNEKLVKLDGSLIIHSVLAREKDTASETKPALRSSDSTRTRDMSKHLNTEKRKAMSSSGSDDSQEKPNSTTSHGEMQRWFREGVAGPMFSSGVCTEVFQFDVSSTSGAINPTSPATHKGKNSRRILRGGHPESHFNQTKHQNNSNTTKPFPSMVVSVLTDPIEEGSHGEVAGGTQSLSSVFIVVLVDGAKYITYSCVLPRPEDVPHLVTT